jgi:pyruvate dehydrogenase E1 component alpha subunit
LVERARRGEGPAFLLCNTYRYYGHHVGDINREYYRPKAEEEEWKSQRDPIANMGTWMQAEGFADQGLLDSITAEVEQEAKDAVEFALEAPYPALDEVAMHVYVD